MSLNGLALRLAEPRPWLYLPLLFVLTASSLLAQTPLEANVRISDGVSVLSAPGLQSGTSASQLIVRFQPGTRGEGLPGARGTRLLSDDLNLHVAEIPRGLTVSQAIAQYRRNPNVIYAEPDFVVQADATNPNDTLWAQQWDMVKIAAPAAWDTYTNAGNVVVAIIDTGVTFSHEDLSANRWINPADNTTSGFNCIGGICVAGNTDDNHGHGTHVAGTIGAVGANGKGIAGINWNVKIAAFKFLNAGGSGNISDAILAFIKIKELIVNNHVNIRVTNNSWGGGGFSQALQDAMLDVEAAGAVNICAAGNSGVNADLAPMYPAAYNNRGIVSVIATDSADVGAGFSNYGLGATDIAAPGVSTLSTVPTTTCSLCDPTGYKTLSGTSMASPHVAGVAAAMMQKNPGLTPAQLRDILLDPASYDWMTTQRAQSTSSGGRLNFYKVLNNPKLMSPPALNNFPSLTMGADVSASAGSLVTISSTSSDPDSDSLRTSSGKAPTSAWLFGWMADSLFPTVSGNPATFTAPSLARTAVASYLGSAADNRGGGASGLQVVTVSPLSNPGTPPVGTLSASSSNIAVGGTITFTYNITDPDGSGIPAWDIWATGAGGASGSCCMTGPSASMQFPSAGAFRVGAQGIDRRLDLSGRSTMVVRVGGATGEPPIASAVLDKFSGPVPLTVNVNMSGSTDPDGTISNYYLGCGGAFVSPGGSSGSCLFTTPGTYWLLLQVMDNSGLMDLVSAYVVATPADGGGGGGGGGGDEDTTPPTVSMQSPAENQTVSGTVTVSANASDASGISKVDFYLDDTTLIGTATTPTSGTTYSIQWNTTTVNVGGHTLKAVATDGASNPGASPLRAVVVEAVPPPPPPPKGPTVSISSPTGGTVARKSTVTISALATPGDNPVNRVDIYVNSGLVCSDTTPANGFSCSWKVPAAPNKTYVINAIARDTAQMSGTSPSVTVTAP